ncbi:Cat operon transcriptional regulator [Serratia fonticola]|uniref:Cat operon transcriptional regulator n=1 Tax=Serratia fonticola TaxID=47917 RepID=A0A4U9WEV0_SERFO|nr:Cat operon transcriptional regulator [Serratia fonticola]
MELRQLRYFVRTVELGSMGQAALDLNIGVSALSQQISRLESELAIRLLQRTSRGDCCHRRRSGLFFSGSIGPAAMPMTPCGPRQAGPLIWARQRRNGPKYWPQYSVCRLFWQWRERYADIRLHVVESLSGNLASMIKVRQLDLAVVFQHKSCRPGARSQCWKSGCS